MIVSGNHKAWEIFSVSVILIFALYCGIKSDIYVDDAFITLKYSRNIVEGRGMVFNQGERILGVTSPLWCWMNALGFVLFPAGRFGALGCHLLSVISVFGAALGFYRLGRELGWRLAGLISAIGFCLLPDHISLFGMEYPLCIWLSLEMLIAFSRGRRKLAGTLGGLMILARPDMGVLAFLVFFSEILFFGKAGKPHSMILYFLIPFIPGAIFLTLYFGSPIPNTLLSKRTQLEAPGFFWAETVGVSVWRYFIVEFLRKGTVEVYLFFAGIASLFIEGFSRRDFLKTRRGFVCVLVFSWAAFHVIALHLLKVAFYRWYLYPVWAAVFFGMAAGLHAIVTFAGNMGEKSRSAGAAVITGIFLMAIVTWQSAWTNNSDGLQKERYEGYRRIAERINVDSAGEKAEALSHEIGTLGFYLGENIKVIDEFFLIGRNPKRPEGRFPNRIELAFQYRPGFLVENHPFYKGIKDDVRAFQEKRMEEDYRETFTGKDGEKITYIPVLKIKSDYGIQVLYRITMKNEKPIRTLNFDTLLQTSNFKLFWVDFVMLCRIVMLNFMI
ncbi:hypothetical protein JW926_06010 [Candidatus Sumerlaeota bacterium]|nr:hypothetical protein [Candidatus Sumerlaeota bacterium]